ncbi:hypothetical protein SLH49_15270 [Cognatiyoonia sp. IB215446]|uniref:hypothetical protein n=1 Tax=Cognatiyoonia sp. IB215446 TaxID=3097355 RepID=UPI002A175F12|nr:hypothetical protein [Cognatiyoonia sp. IB215446]MDX8349346.1 hypothetical protein [Cognatiyoonia sp. IB215446]
MSRLSTIKTAAMTLSIAFGVGFVMQAGQEQTATAAEPVERQDLKSVRVMTLPKNSAGDAVFGVPDVVTTPLDHRASQQTVLPVDAVYAEFAVPEMGTILATPIQGCTATLRAAPEEAAMVSLYLMSPCHEDTDFMLRHEALAFTARTDDEGVASLVVPALAVEATFAALFENVEHARVSVEVPDVRIYDRAILQWDGQYNLQLHALEDGASIGDAGHVWSASVHDAEDAVAGEQGFVLRLGTMEADTPRLAEVYTYPAGHDRSTSQTILQLSVAVTEDNCGREVDTKTIQTSMGGPLQTRQISAGLPSCDAVDQVVVLEDQFKDFALAWR